MKRSLSLFMIAIAIIGCNPAPLKFEEFTFEQNFPSKIVFADGSEATRVDQYLFVRFKAQMNVNDYKIELKKAEVEEVTPDSGTFQVTRPLTGVFVQVKGPSTFKDFTESANTKFGDAWVTPVYTHGHSGNTGDMFAAFPDRLIVRKELVDDFIREQLGNAGFSEVPTPLHEHAYFVMSQKRAHSSLAVSKWLLEVFKDQEDAWFFENVPLVNPALLQNASPAYDLVKIPQARQSSSGTPVKVAVIDHGVNVYLQELTFASLGQVMDTPPGMVSGPALPGLIVDHDHGTIVSSVLGAQTTQTSSFEGVFPGVPILPYSISATDSDVEVAKAIKLATTEGAKVINISLGSTSWRYSVMDRYINYAWNNDVLIIAAAGNNGGPIAKPARHPYVMAIGGSDGDQLMPNSSYGDYQYGTLPGGISLVAPAVGIRGFTFSGQPCTVSGTSVATPIVSGVAALVRTTYPSLKASEVRACLERKATKISNPWATKSGYPNGLYNSQFGYGRLNAEAAMQEAQSMATPPRAMIAPPQRDKLAVRHKR